MKVSTPDKMRSQWPDKLRALQVGDSLLITKAEVPPKNAKALARNVEWRHKRNILFNVLSDENGDTLITCMYRNQHTTIAKKAPGFRQSGIKQKIAAGRAAAAPIRAAAVLQQAARKETTSQPLSNSNGVERLPDGEEACAIIEVTYPDHTHKLIFIKDAEHHGRVLSKTMKDGAAMSVQTFAAGKTMKRKVSWEG